MHEQEFSEETDSSSESSGSKFQDPRSLNFTSSTEKLITTRLNMITDINNKLMALSRVMRKTGLRNKSLRASTFEHIEDEVNKTKVFEEDYLPAVLKYRFSVKEPIQTILLKALARRRRIFDYHRAHQKKLGPSNNAEDVTEVRKQPTRIAVDPLLSNIEPASNEQKIEHLPSRPHDELSTLQPSTVATAFTEGMMKSVAGATISHVSSRSSATYARAATMPDPPSIKPGAEYVICPYCFVYLPRRTLEQKRWIRHLESDLMPYICLETTCTAPNQEFDSIDSWNDHHRSEHSKEWWCSGRETADSRHGPQRFRDLDEFYGHIRTAHRKDFAGLEVSAVARMSATTAELPFDLCPLCDYFGAEVTASSEGGLGARQQEQQPNLRVTPEVMKQHMAAHFLSMFLLTLPEGDDPQGADIVKSSVPTSEVSRETLNDLRDITTDFSNESALRVNDPAVVDDDGHWGIMQEWQYERKPYTGHRTDEMLQKKVKEHDSEMAAAIEEQLMKLQKGRIWQRR